MVYPGAQIWTMPDCRVLVHSALSKSLHVGGCWGGRRGGKVPKRGVSFGARIALCCVGMGRRSARWVAVLQAAAVRLE